MNTEIEKRPPRHIPPPSNEWDFQKMCVHVYAEEYKDPLAHEFGTRGQSQDGLDIVLVPDFRSQPLSDQMAPIGIQCKFTGEKMLPEYTVLQIRTDIKKAFDLTKRHVSYQGLKVFILATNAKDDSLLEKDLQAYADSLGATFRVVVHGWGTISGKIQKSKLLWSLYNEAPNGSVPIEFGDYVDRLNNHIRHHLLNRNFADAKKTEGVWKHAQVSAYGAVEHAPQDIWKFSASLRETLLELYSNSSDSRNAAPLLEFKLNLSGSTNANARFSFLRAQRIASNLRTPSLTFTTVNDGPEFQQLLLNSVNNIRTSEGSPDDIACLALMLIMETDDVSEHNIAIDMMQSLTARASNTQWEMVAKVAHATIRFYYALRHGWNEKVAVHALGDVLLNEYGTPQEFQEWGSLFTFPNNWKLLVAGADPLGPPEFSGRSAWGLVKSLSRRHCPEALGQLKKLDAECEIYSAQKYDQPQAQWKEKITGLSSQRVVDFDALARISCDSLHKKLLDRYMLFATELSYERLLGYRAYLRAYMDGPRQGDTRYSKQLSGLNSLLGTCVALGPKGPQSGLISIVPVYNNPPPRPSGFDNQYASPRLPFTRDYAELNLTAQWMHKIDSFDSRRYELEQRYVDRKNEFALACMLALHKHASMLGYRYEKAVQAGQMGIGVEHPEYNSP